MKPIIACAALALACSALAPASAKTTAKPAIVLVHGAWETAAIWGQVQAGLTKDGYRVLTVSLPGRTGSPMPSNQVSLALYQKTVAATIAHETKPVVLVGHSFAGFVLASEGEAEPAKIKTLVFVAAYLPLSGQSLLSLATTDSGSKVGPLLTIDKTTGYAKIAPTGRGSLFANDAPPAVGDMVASAIVDEPLGPLVTPVHLTPERYGKIDKVYIHTARDQVVSPDFQNQMVASTPVRLELSVDTGHTPFITNPGMLVSEIEQAAK